MSVDGELADRVKDVLAVDPDQYRERAKADAELVKRELRDGTFDNHQSIVGLEYEFFAVGDSRDRDDSHVDQYALNRVPRRMLKLIGFEPELGLHNAEMTITPQPLSNHGLQAQQAEVQARLEAAGNCTRAEGMRLVSDGLWTIPPTGETANQYLTDSVEVNDIRIATNMSDAVRYHAMGNAQAGGMTTMDAPGVELQADTVLPESLITSIQPHFQVVHAADLASYFQYALRVAGPLLAIAVNSPMLPPELYHDHWTGEDVLERGWSETRIPVFESVLNARTDSEKVKFPADIDSTEEAVDRVANDPVFVAMPDSDGDRFDDKFSTFRQKHGTYWRWIRPVFDGATRSSANARIEFRPLPAQPTVQDSLALQAAFAGLMEALPRHQHPVFGLSWEQAKENFYAAARDGIDADLLWLRQNGESTRDTEFIYDDLLDHAVAGLQASGCDEADAERWLAPLRWRVEHHITPASWKTSQLQQRLSDGADLAEAIYDTQREYIREQTTTLIDGNFTTWE